MNERSTSLPGQPVRGGPVRFDTAADATPTVYGHVTATANAIQAALAALNSLEGRVFGTGTAGGEMCKPPAANCLASIAAMNREDAELLARRLQSLAEQIGG